MPSVVIVCECTKKRREDPEVEKAIQFQEAQLGKNRRYGNTMVKGGVKCTICSSVVNK